MEAGHPQAKSPEKVELAIVITTENRFLRNNKVIEGKTSQEVEITPLQPFVGAYARIRRTGKLTINLGDFESAVTEVSVDIPCYLQDLDAADEYAEWWISQRMQKANMQGKKAREAKRRGRQQQQ